MKKIFLSLLVALMATTGAWAQITVSGSGNSRTFGMPAYDVEVSTVMYPCVEKEVTAAQWVAISSPVNNNSGNEDTSWVTNLAKGNYDLLGYDEANAQWLNAKDNGGADGFSTLTKGHGYIYRRNSTETLHFNGDYNTEDVTLSNLSYSGSGDLKGWHLVGNPYNKPITTTAVYFSLTADGTWVKHTGGTLAIGEAVLIHVSSATNSVDFNYSAETMTITGGGSKNTPAVPKALCLGDDCEDSSNQAFTQSSNPTFAYQQDNKIVITQPGLLEAYDMLGRLLFTVDIQYSKFEILNSQFPASGVYILRLDGKSQKIVVK